MNIEEIKNIYKIWAGVSAWYVAYRLLDEKCNDLVADGNVLNAFTLGAGQMGLSMTAGVIVAETLGKLIV